MYAMMQYEILRSRIGSLLSLMMAFNYNLRFIYCLLDVAFLLGLIGRGG